MITRQSCSQAVESTSWPTKSD